MPLSKETKSNIFLVFSYPSHLSIYLSIPQGNSGGVVDYVLDYDIVVSEFDLQ